MSQTKTQETWISWAELLLMGRISLIFIILHFAWVKFFLLIPLSFGKNKTGYTAQDAPSMCTFQFSLSKIMRDGLTDLRTDWQIDKRTDRHNLLQRVTVHLKRRKHIKYKKYFLVRDKIWSSKSGSAYKIHVSWLNFSEIKIRDTFVYKHTL